MVRDDEPSGTILELLRSRYLQVDQPQETQHADVESKEDVDQDLVALPPPIVGGRRQMNERECRQGEQGASAEKGGEGDAGAGQAPDVIQSARPHGATSTSCEPLPTLRSAHPRAGSGGNLLRPRSTAARRFASGRR